jgi:hypothetical protein
MCFLSRVVSVSSCKRTWSVRGHIHLKIHNRLDRACLRSLMARYVAVAVDVSAGVCCRSTSGGACRCDTYWPGEARVAESQSRRVAHLSRDANSRVAAPRLGATRPTLAQASPDTPPLAPADPGPHEFLDAKIPRFPLGSEVTNSVQGYTILFQDSTGTFYVSSDPKLCTLDGTYLILKTYFRFFGHWRLKGIEAQEG